MSQIIHSGTRRPAPRAALSALVLSAAVLAAGCATSESITVGSIPDDYRTNHPIVISEQQQRIDIPVGQTDHRPGRVQATALDGFISGYDKQAAPIVTMLVPAGSPNQLAAGNVASGLADRMHRAGVQRGRIVTQHYDATSHGANAPIRLAYTKMGASAGQCGRWPADLLDNGDNRHWANFGCSYQNNLAAQIANPADLLGPRRMTEIDPQNRSEAIERWREVGGEFVRDTDIGLDF